MNTKLMGAVFNAKVARWPFRLGAQAWLSPRREKGCSNGNPTMKTKLQILVAGMLLATVGTGLCQPCITITTGPQGQTNCAGSLVTLSVVATGAEPLRYQWQHAFDLYNYVDRQDETNSTLIINNFQNLSSGNYRVIITNAECSVTSAEALLTLARPPTITLQPTNFLVLSLGASVANRVGVNSSTAATFQWRFNGTNMPGQTRSSIILTNLQIASEGGYDVVIANMCGSVTSRVAVLGVDPAFFKVTKPDVVQGSADMFMPYWVDPDGDGWLDLVVVGGWNTAAGKSLMVYENNRDGTLSRNLTNDLSKVSGRFISIAWADLDNDGDLDAFLASWEGQTPLYLRNEGNGKFTKFVANASWTANRIATVGSTVSCADFENDGILDLVAGYWGNAATGVWGTNTVLRGLGDGRFEVDRRSPLAISRTWPEFFSWADWDGDGRLDLFGATSYDTNQVDIMFRNLGGGQFLRITNSPLVKVPDVSLNAAWGDYDNDGDLDVCVTSWNTTNQLYRNLGNGVFEVDPASPRFPSGENRHIAAWGDYDNDGWLDLFIVHYNRASRLFHNRGDGTFEEITTGSPVAECKGYGSAWGDYDNDGFLDLCAVYADGAANYLYRNNLRNVGNTNHWLKLRLTGRASNRSGIGATVRVKATIGGAELWQMRQIVCQGFDPALLAHFGLGDATNVTTLRIEWPSGIVQELQNVGTEQTLTIVENQGYVGAAPQFSGATKDAAGAELSFTEPVANARYFIEASTNLVNWTKLTARTSAGVATKYMDTSATNYTRRFYRLQVP
jgi:hypothetical protein